MPPPSASYIDEWSIARDAFLNDAPLGRSIIAADVLAYSESISRDLLALIETHAGERSLDFNRCKFESPVDLRSLCANREVIFHDCEFFHSVNGNGVVFSRPVKFIGCRFHQSLDLQEAVFRRGLTATFSLVEMKEPDGSLPNEPELHEAPARNRSAWWPGLRVTGLLRLDRSFFGGALNLADARIDGPVLMRGVRIGCQPRKEKPGAGRLHMRNVRIAGDLELCPHTRGREPTTAEISHVEGSVVLAGCDIAGSVDLRGAIIECRLHMPQAHVRDQLDAGVWHHDSDNPPNCVHGMRIGHKLGVSVSLADAEIGHGVVFDGAVLQGQLNAKNARVGGDFYLRQAYERNGHMPISDGCSVILASDAPLGMEELTCPPKLEGYNERAGPIRVGLLTVGVGASAGPI